MGSSSDHLSESSRRWHPPRHFKNYALEMEIDGGGMGIVYRARTIDTQKAVAIKFLLDKSQQKRFRREIDAGQRLQHPNFVRFHDTGVVDDHFYIVMDYIEGEPLKRYMEKVNLSSDRRLEIFYMIASAMGYAHKCGIIHRDLKPANILINKEEEPIILDFGLAKYIEMEEDVTALTVEGQILGTPGYMSPEQARGEVESQDARSDVFCLGIILYEMLTARNPFEGNNFLEVCYNIAHKSPPDIEKILPGIPSQLSYICNKALARNKEYRYPDAQEFANDIQAYLISRKKARLEPTIHYPELMYASTPTADTVVHNHILSPDDILSKQEEGGKSDGGGFPPITPILDGVEEASTTKSPPELKTEVIEQSYPSIPVTPPLNPGERVKKMMCPFCGALNPLTSDICQRCGENIRIPRDTNVQEKRSERNYPPDFGVPQEPVLQKSALPQNIGHATPGRGVPKKVHIQMTGVEKKKPIVISKKPEKINKREVPKVPQKRKKVSFLLGMIGMFLSLFPVARELLIPWYGYLFDIVFGGLSEALLVRWEGGGKAGVLLFSMACILAFAAKYTSGVIPQSVFVTHWGYILIGIALAGLWGANLGLFFRLTK